MPKSHSPRHKYDPSKGLTKPNGQSKRLKRDSKTIKVNGWLNLKLEAITIKSSWLTRLIISFVFVLLLSKLSGYNISDILLLLSFAQKK